MRKINDNQCVGRFVSEQILSNRHSNACCEQCGCSYVERYGPEAFVSDAEFDRKCRARCQRQKRYNPCNEQCGCSYVERYGPEAVVSDAEYDLKCSYCHFRKNK